MARQPIEPRWLRETQLAEYLGITRPTLEAWRKQADLGFPAFATINGMHYTNVELVEEWMRQQACTSAQRSEQNADADAAQPGGAVA